MASPQPISVSLFASKMTSASGLFGLYDILCSVGVGWEAFVTGEPQVPRFSVQIISETVDTFRCASGVLVTPDARLDEVSKTDILIVPGIAASASQPLGKENAGIIACFHDIQDRGARMVSACTGALYRAEAGLLDDVEATTHWAYGDLSRSSLSQGSASSGEKPLLCSTEQRRRDFGRAKCLARVGVVFDNSVYRCPTSCTRGEA